MCGIHGLATVARTVLMLLLLEFAAASTPEVMTEAVSRLHDSVKPGDLNCSACLWAARAVREGLTQKMKKKVKSPTLRRKLADEVLSARDDSGVCAPSRFPKDPVLWTGPQNERRYRDLIEVRGGKQAAITSEHFKLMETKDSALKALLDVCQSVRDAFAGSLVDRVEAHKGPRIFGAVTDHWLCFRATRLCSEKEAPAGGDDDDDDTEL
eukprot:TRINITY_DN95360_c0_g1_i1.p1 TRINITY_DN95360_c0_g1~~TRINITY_DN95360_c0_g1_i1.p1  ORF type:complete len:210 (+),score=28.28 TRINITY_DN95360_c0_g1_i1:55-684(+)